MFTQNLVFAQVKEVSLNDCYENLAIHYPIVRDLEVYTKSNELKIKNLNSEWLPKAELKAQATYQSEVLALDIDLPIAVNLPKGSQDQYKATIDVNQMIYDFGRIKSSKKVEQSNFQINQQINLVELNKIKEQINKFYFAVLVLQKNEELMNIMLKDIDEKQLVVESGVKNGVLLSSELYALQAEKLKLKQNITQIINQRIAAIQVLSELTGLDLGSDVRLVFPEVEISSDAEMQRLEHQLFDFQAEQLNASINMLHKQNMPVLFAFGQLGYGKPGLNMLNEEFDSFYIVGVGLNWKFWDWNQNRRQREIISLNKNLIDSKRESFNKQLNIALDNEMATIQNLQSALITDQDIIKLRQEITKTAFSKLENGTYTSSQYLTELNAETQAKINYETHKIQLAQSKVNYLYILGKI